MNRVECLEKIKKLLKKVLTKGNDGDIITKLSAEAGGNWTLKIEQRKTRVMSEDMTVQRI